MEDNPFFLNPVVGGFTYFLFSLIQRRQETMSRPTNLLLAADLFDRTRAASFDCYDVAEHLWW